MTSGPRRMRGEFGWLRARRRPARRVRPPVLPAQQATRFNEAPRDGRFITGNGFATRCRYVINYGEPTENPDVDNDWWFCKTDVVEHFFDELAPTAPFVLFTHNSDHPVDRRYRRRLRRRQLVAWFAANAAFDHPKLHAIPLGIANPVWPHGDVAALLHVQREQIRKTRLFDASFAVSTNRAERRACIAATGLEPDSTLPYGDYLRRLASAYFCISPRGNGIDTHRTWEALYVGTIPVVTRSLIADRHPDLPLVVLDRWSDFRRSDFSAERYMELWGDWDVGNLTLDAYVGRIEAMLAQAR